jgi:hypothetical protein
MDSRVIWCLGMYASASTWMLNAVREIQVASGQMDLAIQFVRDTLNPEMLNRTHAVSVVKSHEIIDESALVALAGRCDTILMSIRNPLDAVASVMEYQKTGFGRAVDLVQQSSALCLDYLKDRRTTCFVYESRFFDDPATMLSLSRLMGVTLSHEAVRDCFDRLRRSAVETYIKGLPLQKGVLRDLVSGDYLDPVTQWHTHHAGRSGEIGRWRQKLSAEEAREIHALSETHRITGFIDRIRKEVA